MKVTRDVILDLWPVYEAGEASADTRALVETFLEADPEFARTIRDERRELMSQTVSVALPPDQERTALQATQTLLRRRMQYLALGLGGTLLSALYRFNAPWMRWGDLEVLRLLVLGAGVAGWVLFWRAHARLRVKGL
jgi:ferric-dicitrate binding protein FerR (iron transport regulator)